MTYLLNLAAEAIQWLACIFLVAVYLDYRRLRRRVDHMEEASRWRSLIEGGDDPRNHEGWHAFQRNTYEFEAGRDVVHLWDDKRMPKVPRPLPSDPARKRA
jgi:hypothetical protein